jgi:ubiquinone/menaquinone biosynthesis C-methylase UbiE
MTAGRESGEWNKRFYDEAWHRIEAPLMSPQRTQAEVRCIVRVLDLSPPARLLDLCCGYGRTAVPLAALGYEVTGVDLSPSLLRRARRAAKEAGVDVRWHRGDMREIPWEGGFEAGIIMNTSLGLLESREEEQKVLDGVARALKPGGRFLIDAMNREMWIRGWQSLTQPMRVELSDGALYESRWEMDLEQGLRRQYGVVIEKDGARHEYVSKTRLYSFEELSEMLEVAGLAFCQAWGDFGGREYGAESPRMIVLAEKEA